MSNRRLTGPRGVLLALAACGLLLGLAGVEAEGAGRPSRVVRLGYFPNITHSQALLGVASGEFVRALGPGVELRTKVFNAGPSVIEALFAGELDLSYIGPNPAINGYVRSGGEALRIIAGATSGGAALVVREGAGIRTAGDFHGKRIASPQLGNTQDVALRAWLGKHGYRLKEKGGDVEVIPLKNPDQLALFLKGEIDAAWTVEPWASRLIHEGKGRLFLDERQLWPDGDFVTAHVIVSTKFLRDHPDLVRRFLRAHVDLTRWIAGHLPEAKRRLNDELRRLTGKALPKKVLDDAFSRLEVTYDPVSRSLFGAADSAFALGFLGREKPDLSGIYALDLLNEVLAEKKLAPVR
ncbi:MAG: ABC transporter substrate-binding protein [Bacillota bacterium]|nr:ABC transporter substrate-binding protein [Bacillota bacterium]